MLRFELVSVRRCRHYSLSPIQRKKILLKCEKGFFNFMVRFLLYPTSSLFRLSYIWETFVL